VTDDGSAANPPADMPLDEWCVVVTGDVARTSGLAGRVVALGAGVVRLPVVSVEDAPDGGVALGAAADRLSTGGYDWVVVTSANAVVRLQRALSGRPVPGTVHWAAVGPTTGKALDTAGLPCHLVPAAATADALATELVASATPGHVLYPRAEVVRSDLSGRLSAAGWIVDEVVAYRTAGAAPDASAVGAARRADAILFTSGSAVDQTVALLGAPSVPPLVVTIGPSTSAAAEAAGLRVAAEAEPHSAEGLAAALVSLARSGNGMDRRLPGP
jgi:uroporphyrinogen-III synthase